MQDINNMQKFIDLRDKYSTFRYKNYSIDEDNSNVILSFSFSIDGLEKFESVIKIEKDNLEIFKKMTFEEFKNDSLVNEIVKNIGLVELVSYIKCTCSKNIIVECFDLDDFQKSWFTKLYYNGLSEMLYRNSINIEKEELFQFVNGNEKTYNSVIKANSAISEKMSELNGNLVLVGGGKDSCVTLELLNNDFNKNMALVVGKRGAMIDTLKVAGYTDNKIIKVDRIIDQRLISLNQKGFLNGHTPFSALLAFLSYLIAYMSCKKYIVLSNEQSSNQSNILGTNVNHQYSKSYEFESDFLNYCNKYFKTPIKYFSILRPITELQIASIFSKYDKYFKAFKSCNVGLKNNIWCGNCSKCLFVYVILSPFLSQEELIDIFSKDLFNDKQLENIFIDLIGEGNTKPFECVGTFDEINVCICKTISNYEDKLKLPYLLKIYYDKFYDKYITTYGEDTFEQYKKMYFEENNLDEEFKMKLKEKLNIV